MSQFLDTGYGTFVAGADLMQFQRVNADGTVAGPTLDIGVNTRGGILEGQPFCVSGLNKPGTHKAIAADAIAKGDTVFCVGGGMVASAASGGTVVRGMAMEEAFAAGDVIEVLPIGLTLA